MRKSQALSQKAHNGESKNRAFKPQNRRGKRACIIDTGVSRKRSLITTLQIALGYSIFCRLIPRPLRPRQIKRFTSKPLSDQVKPYPDPYLTTAPEKLPILNALSTFSDSTFPLTIAVLPVDPQQRLSEQPRHALRHLSTLLRTTSFLKVFFASALSRHNYPHGGSPSDLYTAIHIARRPKMRLSAKKQSAHCPLSEPRSRFALTVAVKGSLILSSFPPSSEKKPCPHSYSSKNITVFGQ